MVDLQTHFPSLAVYLYWVSEVIPLSMTYQKAASISPPLHPSFPQAAVAQSTICCSERFGSFPSSMATNPSMAPTAENAQHDPHWPWFLTAWTAPLVLQSTEAGGLVTSLTLPLQTEVTPFLYLRQSPLNSTRSRSANMFISRSQVSNPMANLALWAWTAMQLALNLLNLQTLSSSEAYTLECNFIQFPNSVLSLASALSATGVYRAKRAAATKTPANKTLWFMIVGIYIISQLFKLTIQRCILLL